MKFCKYFRDHIGFCHRVHRSGTTDHKRVPGSNNTAHTAYNNNLCHYRSSESFCHSICSYQSCSTLRNCDFSRIQDITNRKNNERIKNNCQYYRKDHHFADFFQRYIDFFCCLRDNVKTNKEKWCDNSNFQDIFCHGSCSLTHKHLSLKIINITIDHRSHDQKDSGTSNDTGQYCLKYCCCLCSHDIDQGN